MLVNNLISGSARDAQEVSVISAHFGDLERSQKFYTGMKSTLTRGGVQEDAASQTPRL